MFTTQLNSTTVLLRGTITHLSRHQGAADFLASQKQKDNLATAILTTFASGNDGLGASLANMSDITVESADYLSFQIDGKNVEVCVWASNFLRVTTFSL
ncbi:hypothetical protein [Robbsia andropogonis]|uniref:hypothetical protein n=1 Tax=Robbsia andropogonis TaxID=28092 RepID=UPI0004664DB6|nr:hypothetical protein [Robbsia andropogonis]